MIRDLMDSGEGDIEADVAVIGAGTVGLPVAALLARRANLKVVCLESGGRRQEGETHPQNAVVHLKSVYAGADSGRYRCLGGTSSRWGGAMIPFQESDLVGHDWPVTYSEMSQFLPSLERIFGLEAGPYTDESFPFAIGEHHVARLAKWPPFKKRNVYNLFREDCESPDGPQIVLNAIVTAIDVSKRGEVALTAFSPSRTALRVKAKRLIIAAGAIETTRLALLLDRQNASAITSISPKLGRYFADHLSVPVADIVSKDRRRLNNVVGYRFGRGGSMRNLRFEFQEGSPLRGEIAPTFCHIAFETGGKGGFDALKEIYRSLQMNRLPSLGNALSLLKSLPWLARAAWWRFVKHRLLYPGDARISAHMVIEQTPTERNRIALSADKKDALGIPLAEIDWSVSDADLATLTRSTDAMEAAWYSTDLRKLGDWVRRPAGEAERDLLKGGGIYHPTGSTRMASTAAEGVVDRDLKLFGVPEVQLLSTSVLPNGGGSNPTMMLMLLGLRCVEQFCSTLSAGR